MTPADDNNVRVIEASGKTLFTITGEGDVVPGEDVTWTEAAQAFWTEVKRLAPGHGVIPNVHQLHDAADHVATPTTEGERAALVAAEFIETSNQIQEAETGRPIEIWQWREILGYGIMVGILASQRAS